MGKGITTLARVSIYKGVASRNAGRQFDRDIIAFAATGIIPKNDTANRFMSYLGTKMKLSKLATQVRVSSPCRCSKTFLDF